MHIPKDYRNWNYQEHLATCDCVENIDRERCECYSFEGKCILAAGSQVKPQKSHCKTMLTQEIQWESHRRVFGREAAKTKQEAGLYEISSGVELFWMVWDW